MSKKIKLQVVVCNLCGFSVTGDPVGIEAMGNHYRNDHKDKIFNFWKSMHKEEMTI